MLVEILSLREQQVTENTLLLLQLLVNSSHMTTQIAPVGRQLVALLASKTNPLRESTECIVEDSQRKANVASHSRHRCTRAAYEHTRVHATSTSKCHLIRAFQQATAKNRTIVTGNLVRVSHLRCASAYFGWSRGVTYECLFATYTMWSQLYNSQSFAKRIYFVYCSSVT
jgi:hypothetical protein